MRLTHDQLYSLEQYERIRNDFRAIVMEHKKRRCVAIGAHAALYFEDNITVQYQVQEMLYVERIFERRGVQDKLDVYNPLIPDGSNWKATFMVDYEDEAERRNALARLISIEKTVWVQVEGFGKIHPVADEALDRETEGKTASVHFLRFELTPQMVTALKQGAIVQAGINLLGYHQEAELPKQVRDSLAGDLR